MELIRFLKIEQQAVLVTSRFKEKSILDECKNIGVKIIPKVMISLIPIALNSDFYDYVYIDDDILLRMTWQRKAELKNKKLLALESTLNFDEYKEKISKEFTTIYIDSNLGIGEIKGEDFAVMLRGFGYKKICIASGYGKEHFSHLPWLECIGKICPI